MKKYLGAILCLLPFVATNASVIQSTSSDWEAVTGMHLSEYTITFSNTKVSGNTGWEVYYLDEFPCYGMAQYVRAWFNANNNDDKLLINCLKKPTEIKLAYRSATRDAYQDKTTGILTCNVEKNLSIDLSKCQQAKWSDFANE